MELQTKSEDHSCIYLLSIYRWFL